MATGKARGGMTRRALLVAGGVTLLVAYVREHAQHPADAVGTSAGQTAPAPTPGRPPTVTPSAEPSRPPGSRPAPARLARKEPAGTRPARTAPPAAGRGPGGPRGPRGQTGDLPMTHVDDGRMGIALTIDDGPSPVYTPQILRLLEKYQVTATFSMIGLEVDANPAVAREVAAAGHVIANHTWSHVNLAFLPPAAVADQVNRATGAIRQVTGREPTLFRAPYGAWSPAVLQYCAQARMTPLDWSVDPRDWSRPGVTSIVGNIMRNTTTGSIILEHDGGGNRAQTVAALRVVLPRLLDAGYHFTTP
jgi:peptidoglycan-N-acetylglucosamine deacetylase